MDIVQQKRADIIKENNTAQEEFASIIENLNPNTTTELTIRTKLYGNLNLGEILEDRFPNLNSIKFYPGEITEIRNIPSGITRFECPGNLLTELDGGNLPGSLLILDITDNYLRTLDLVGSPNLEELRCNNNRIEEFRNLPTTLVTLFCNQNQLRKLNLRGIDRLKTLHCSENPILRIENLPSNIHDFSAENSPFALEIEESDNDSETEDSNILKKNKEKMVDRRINYLDALQLYYRTKHDYEEKLLKKRRLAYKRAPTKKMGRTAANAVLPSCIYCNRPVGTRFYTNSTGHFAVCGDKTAPCALNIKLQRGSFNMKSDLLYIFKEEIEEGKERVIRQKLDSLFNYYSDEAAIQNFKKFMENYSLSSLVYEDYVRFHKELYFNEQKKEMIHKKTNKINEILEEIQSLMKDYNETETPATLKTAMELYVRDLMPEVENLRRLKYGVVEIEDNVLIEMPNRLSELEHGFLDEPKVVEFKGL